MMSSFQIIIDGYNLLHAAGFARRSYGPGGLHKSRQQLLKFLLRNLTAAERDQTIIVFDARDRPLEASDHAGVLEGIRILFASPHGDADVIVEELIAQHSAPKRLTVVSSDRRLQTAARHRHALYIDSESFVEDLLRRPPLVAQNPVAPHPKHTGEVPSAEVEFWLREFAGILDDIPATERSPDPKKKTVKKGAVQQGADRPEPACSEPARKEPTKSKPVENPSSKPAVVKPHHAPGDGDRRKSSKTSEHPAIFSEAWLVELQQWVDQLQHKRRK